MKALLFALFVGLLFVGCGESLKSSEPVESAKAIDLDDPATLEEILVEAINIDEYIHVGNEVLKNGSPITGWVKNTDEHGVRYLGSYKNGKHDGPWIRWYKSGNKDDQGCYKDGKRNGLWLDLKKDGTVRTRKVYKLSLIHISEPTRPY